MSISWLSIHAGYACRHSGACCTSNWPIPVEAGLVARLEDAVACGTLAAPGGAFAGGPPRAGGIGAVLRTTAAGACVFYDGSAVAGRCSVHRALGPAAIPASCRHFPRVYLEDGRGVCVTLSHYCPTAAGMLFREDAALAIVEGRDLEGGEEPEGLDAREALPPQLTPRVLMDLDAYARWEALAVRILAAEGVTAEGALSRLAAAAERLRGWRPGGASLVSAVAALDLEAHSLPAGEREVAALDLAPFDEVRGCVPAPWAWDPAPEGCARAWERLAADSWPALARPVRFYLASKAFASWPAYQGQGLRTVVRSLEAALSVLKVEALRIAMRAGTGVDADVLREAFRRADLLLVHMADREALARVWSLSERQAARGGPAA